MDSPQIQRALGRIEGKLDSMIVTQTRQEEVTGSLGRRVTKLEHASARLVGLAAGIGATGGALGGGAWALIVRLIGGGQ